MTRNQTKPEKTLEDHFNDHLGVDKQYGVVHPEGEGEDSIEVIVSSFSGVTNRVYVMAQGEWHRETGDRLHFQVPAEDVIYAVKVAGRSAYWMRQWVYDTHYAEVVHHAIFFDFSATQQLDPDSGWFGMYVEDFPPDPSNEPIPPDLPPYPFAPVDLKQEYEDSWKEWANTYYGASYVLDDEVTDDASALAEALRYEEDAEDSLWSAHPNPNGGPDMLIYDEFRAAPRTMPPPPWTEKMKAESARRREEIAEYVRMSIPHPIIPDKETADAIGWIRASEHMRNEALWRWQDMPHRKNRERFVDELAVSGSQHKPTNWYTADNGIIYALNCNKEDYVGWDGWFPQVHLCSTEDDFAVVSVLQFPELTYDMSMHELWDVARDCLLDALAHGWNPHLESYYDLPAGMIWVEQPMKEL